MKTLHFHTELIDGCKKSKRASQHALYKQYAKGMYNVCVRMVGDSMTAEDVLQEAFVDVYKNIKSYKGDSTPGAWIKRIVVNKCISHLRKKKVYLSDIDEVAHVPETKEDNEDYTYEVQQIKNAMRLLPQGYKAIFSLYTLEGYDHEEIASIMKISVSTSKSQYHRAKKKLKEIITLQGNL